MSSSRSFLALVVVLFLAVSLLASAQPAVTPLTTLIIESNVNTTSSPPQKNFPITFGQPFKTGDVLTGEYVVGRISVGEGASTTLLTSNSFQVDYKARHPDGSLRHAIISVVIPTLSARKNITLEILKTNVAPTRFKVPHPRILLDVAKLSVKVVQNCMTDGKTYTTDLEPFLRRGEIDTWLSGPVVMEWMTAQVAPGTLSSGPQHPLLTLGLNVRYYVSTGKFRVEGIFENVKTWSYGSRYWDYNTTLYVNEQAVYTNLAYRHYKSTRWHAIQWAQPEAQVHLRHNTAFLIRSRAVGNYDQTIQASSVFVHNWYPYVLSDDPNYVGPGKPGPVLKDMGTTGGRPDIGPLPAWSVEWILGQDRDSKKVMMAAADAAAAFQTQARDEFTGYPVRLDRTRNRQISAHGNYAGQGPLPVPRCFTDGTSTNFCEGGDLFPETAHQPSMAYLPYVITGEYWLLQTLQLYAAANCLGTAPGFHGMEQCLISWDQMRGQAWSFRTLAHAAYATPDNHPMKKYFVNSVNYNIDFYYKKLVVNGVNKLGAYTFEDDELGNTFPSSWQDDFMTYTFYQLIEFGFDKDNANLIPLHRWKAQYSIGRMTAPGYCWVESAPYDLHSRPIAVNGGAVFARFAQNFTELYDFHWKYDNYARFQDDNFNVLPMASKNTNGTAKPEDYFKLPCGSPEAFDWRNKYSQFPWSQGQMWGYEGSVFGYPEILRMALSTVQFSGLPNAQKAWDTFKNRSFHSMVPYGTDGPVFAFVPRLSGDW